MTIQTTRWTPDTCDPANPCVIDYTWDDTVPADSRVHTFSNYVNRCSVHVVQADDNTRYNTVTEENPRKNIARQIIIDNAPLSFVDVDPITGAKTLKAGLNIDFTVAGTPPNRVFTMIFTGTLLTTNQKNTVQNRLDTRFGVGKVIFSNPG